MRSVSATRRLGVIALVGVISSTLVYARWVEPVWLEVTHHEVRVPGLAHPVKLAHLTDLHTRGLGVLERRVLEALSAEQPDVVLVTGDSLNAEQDQTAVDEFNARLHAPLGVYFVNGNWETGSGRAHRTAKLTVLTNETADLGNGVLLVGLDGYTARIDELTALTEGSPSGRYRVGLFHAPSLFNDAAPLVDLALAGHTHGGQVRLPGLPPWWLPPGSGGFVSGWYAQGRSKLYVSRGLGTSILPLRFGSRPELAIITLTPAAE